jgi:hypothetical protein
LLGVGEIQLARGKRRLALGFVPAVHVSTKIAKSRYVVDTSASCPMVVYRGEQLSPVCPGTL